MEHLLGLTHMVSHDARCEGGGVWLGWQGEAEVACIENGGRGGTKAGPFLLSASSLPKQTGRSSRGLAEIMDVGMFFKL